MPKTLSYLEDTIKKEIIKRMNFVEPGFARIDAKNLK